MGTHGLGSEVVGCAEAEALNHTPQSLALRKALISPKPQADTTPVLVILTTRTIMKEPEPNNLEFLHPKLKSPECLNSYLNAEPDKTSTRHPKL